MNEPALPDDVTAEAELAIREALVRSRLAPTVPLLARDALAAALPIIAPAIAAQARRQAIKDCYARVEILLNRRRLIYETAVFDALYRIDDLLHMDTA